jgi:hypothetical protein
VRRGKADSLIYTRLGKQKKSLDSIVLRREYVNERVSKSKINGRKLVPVMLKSASVMSFKKGVIRSKNGTAIELDLNCTDAAYWNTVLVQLGLGKNAGRFLKDAAKGMGLAVSLTTLEFRTADAKPAALSGLDATVSDVRADEITEHVRGTGHRVYPRGPGANSDDPNDMESESPARVWTDVNRGPKDEQRAAKKPSGIRPS